MKLFYMYIWIVILTHIRGKKEVWWRVSRPRACRTPLKGVYVSWVLTEIMEPSVLFERPDLSCMIIWTRGKKGTRMVPSDSIHSILGYKTTRAMVEIQSQVENVHYSIFNWLHSISSPILWKWSPRVGVPTANIWEELYTTINKH